MDMLKAVQHRIARDIVVTFFVSHFVITMLVMLIDVDREAMKQEFGLVGVVRSISFLLRLWSHVD
jgi:lipopolysaccharide export system permease protein